MKTNVVVAGWGQVTQPKEISIHPEDPMGLMVQASNAAAGTLKTPALLSSVDGILTVKSLSAHYDDPARVQKQGILCSGKSKPAADKKRAQNQLRLNIFLETVVQTVSEVFHDGSQHSALGRAKIS